MQSPHLCGRRTRLRSIAGQRGSAARPLLYFLALVAIVCAVAGTTYAVVNRTAGPLIAVASETTPRPPKPVFVELEPFTVTVADNYAERILHVGFTLRVSDEPARQQIVQYLPEVRSNLLVLLSEQDPNTLQSADEKRALARKVREALNAGTADGRVLDVLFHAFVVQ